jgi:lipopolysaccharide export system protein LptA
MEAQYSKPIGFCNWRLLAAVFIIPTTLLGTLAWGDTQTKNNPPEEKIRVVSDKLVSGSDEKYIEFIGNVKTTQGTSEITSDTLKVYYKGNVSEGGDEDTPSAGEESIEKIVATGNVKFNLDGREGETEEAVYLVDERIIVLTGKNSKIKSGKNFVAGSKITLYRDTGKINVEGTRQKRVEMVIHTKGKGLK